MLSSPWEFPAKTVNVTFSPSWIRYSPERVIFSTPPPSIHVHLGRLCRCRFLSWINGGYDRLSGIPFIFNYFLHIGRQLLLLHPVSSYLMSAFLLGLHSTTHWESKCTCKAAKSGHPHWSTVATRMNWMLGESGFQSLRWAKESIFGIKYSFIFSCKITLYTNSPPCLPVRYHEFGYHPKWYPKCVLLTLTEPPF